MENRENMWTTVVDKTLPQAIGRSRSDLLEYIERKRFLS